MTEHSNYSNCSCVDTAIIHTVESMLNGFKDLSDSIQPGSSLNAMGAKLLIKNHIKEIRRGQKK